MTSDKVIKFKDIIVSPMEELIEANIGLSTHKGGPHWPDFYNQLNARHCRFDFVPVDEEPSKTNYTKYINKSVIWCGPISTHFGHQISEFSMRILNSINFDPNATLLFAANSKTPMKNIENTPIFFRNILNWFGIKDDQIEIVNDSVMYSEVSVFPQAELLHGPKPSNIYLDKLDFFVSKKFIQTTKKDIIYVSRGKFNKGIIAGEKYIEEIFGKMNIKIIYPEKMTLENQLKTYMSAKRLIFSEGSALHSLQLLGRNLEDVFILFRRPNISIWDNIVESRAKNYFKIETINEILFSYNIYNTPLEASGISLLNEKDFLNKMKEYGLEDITLFWDSNEFNKKQNDDIINWLKKESETILANKNSKKHIIDTLKKSNFIELANLANYILPNVSSYSDESVKHIKLSNQWINKGNMEEALNEIELAIELDSNVPGFHRHKSVLLNRLGKNDLALDCANKVKDILPNDPHIYAHISNILSSMGKNEEALNEIELAIKIDNNVAGFHRHKSVLLNRLGKNDLALDCANKVKDILPNDPHIYAHISNILSSMGKNEEALNEIELAIKIDNNIAGFHRHKSVLLNRLKLEIK